MFDPKKADCFRPVTMVKVGGPTTVDMRPCSCGEHRDRYYINGIEGHYVKAEDYDALLALYEHSQATVSAYRDKQTHFAQFYDDKKFKGVGPRPIGYKGNWR